MEKFTKAITATSYEMTSHKIVWKYLKEKNQYNWYALSWVSAGKNRPLVQNDSCTSQPKIVIRKEDPNSTVSTKAWPQHTTLPCKVTQ